MLLLGVSDNFLSQKYQVGWLELLVGHGEDAIPIGGRLVEEIFLTVLPVGASRAVVGPLIEKGLKGGLGIEPMARLEESASFAKAVHVCVDIGGDSGGGADEFINDDRLGFSLDANEIEFTEDEIGIFGREVGGFVYEDVGAVVFVEAFEAGREVHGIAQRGVAITKR
jgi:hypothetical protein